MGVQAGAEEDCCCCCFVLFFSLKQRCAHHGVNHIYLSHEWEIINHSSQVKSFIYAVGLHFIEERCVLWASASLHFSKWFKSSWHLLVSTLNTLLLRKWFFCCHPAFAGGVFCLLVLLWSKITACFSHRWKVNCNGYLLKEISGGGGIITHPQLSLRSFSWSENDQTNPSLYLLSIEPYLCTQACAMHLAATAAMFPAPRSL